MKPSDILSLHRNEFRSLALESGLMDVRVFGSTARGEDRDDSDLDLLVCVADETLFFPAMGFIVELQRRFAQARIDAITDAITDVMVRPDVLRAALREGFPL